MISSYPDLKWIHIAAISKNYVIGKDGDLPWHIPDDLKHFKAETKNKIIVLGRKSYDSLRPKPLPNRYHIVITRNLDSVPSTENVITVSNMDEAAKVAQKNSAKWGNDIMICGGGEIYKQTLEIADELILTHVDIEIAGDTFYPKFDPKDFIISKQLKFEGPPQFVINWYKRK